MINIYCMYNQLVAGVMLPIYSTVFLALLWGWDVSQKNGGFTRGSGDSNKFKWDLLWDLVTRWAPVRNREGGGHSQYW